jgi:hypothetical protein
VDFLLSLTNTTDDEVVDENFPNEHLFSISVESPWFDNIGNYLAIGRFPQHFFYKEHCKIIRKSATYTWIRGYLFKLGLV